jgi:hypothetical protein
VNAGDRNDVVGVAVPPPHRHLHVGRPETPVPPQQSGIVDHRQAAAPEGIDHVVDEDRLDFRIGEHPLVVGGPRAGVAAIGVMRDGDQGCQ